MSHAVVQTSNVLLVLGLAVALFGVFVDRLVPALARWKKVFMIGGVILYALAIAIAWPDLVAGFREGYKQGLTTGR